MNLKCFIFCKLNKRFLSVGAAVPATAEGDAATDCHVRATGRATAGRCVSATVALQRGLSATVEAARATDRVPATALAQSQQLPASGYYI